MEALGKCLGLPKRECTMSTLGITQLNLSSGKGDLNV